MYEILQSITKADLSTLHAEKIDSSGNGAARVIKCSFDHDELISVGTRDRRRTVVEDDTERLGALLAGDCNRGVRRGGRQLHCCSCCEWCCCGLAKVINGEVPSAVICKGVSTGHKQDVHDEGVVQPNCEM